MSKEVEEIMKNGMPMPVGFPWWDPNGYPPFPEKKGRDKR